MKKTLSITSVVLCLFLLVISCFREDNMQEVGVPHIDMPTEIRENNGELKIALMISHRFLSIHQNKKNQPIITLIEKAQKEGTFLTFYFESGTNRILKVEEVSEAVKKNLQDASIPKVQNNGTLNPVIPDLNTVNELFEGIKAQTCSFDKEFPCISFDYPEDGCYARAHKMKQYLAERGYDCEKQFIYGDLRIRYDGITPEKGGCCVNWSYHTSVLVSYKDENGQIKKLILDPAISKKGPLLAEDWRKACLNSSCGKVELTEFVTVPSDIYARNRKGQVLYDPNYKNTDCVLKIFSRVFGCTLPVPSTESCGF